MTDMTKLADAIEAVKLATPDGQTWTERDFSDDANPPDIDQHIATILNAVVSGDLAEVIALRAEVERLEARHDDDRLELDRLTSEGEALQARATAAEADADRLAGALAFSKRYFGFNAEVLNALAAHTQRVNAKEEM